MEWKCINCGKIRQDYPNIAKKRKYCSTKCQMNYEYENKIRDKNKTIEKAHEVLRTRGHYKRNNDYLSKPGRISKKARKRMSLNRLGKGNPMYGKRPWNKLSPTKKWWEEKEFKELRKKCLKRDNYACVECGEKEKDLYCDHIIPYRICKEHKLKNLQMLCGKHHSQKTVKDIKKYFFIRKRNNKGQFISKK